MLSPQRLPHTSIDSIQKGATFSNDQRYRYSLWRIWNENLPKVLWIGLNPSTADEQQDDNTIRKCIAFAKIWSCGSIYMTNLFAYRSTDPKFMLKIEDPIGGNDNDLAILNWLGRSDIIVRAWGNYGSHLQRSAEIKELLSQAKSKTFCLGYTKNGQPRHPLYLPYTTMRQNYFDESDSQP